MVNEGGCLCGAVRYRCATAPEQAGYCHCRLCQRSSGAPVLAWATYPVESFEYGSGAPRIHRSSSHGQREFCGDCGTQILYRESEDAKTVDINVASLDDPETVTPQVHVWTASRISWFDVADDLPRREGSGIDS